MKKEKIIIESILGLLIVIISTLLLIKPWVLNSLKKAEVKKEEPLVLPNEETINKGSILLGMKVLYEGEGINFDERSNIVSINKGGEYDISGNFINGQIVIDTSEDVKLVLMGVNIQNTSLIPLNIINTNNITIELTASSYNTFKGSSGITALGALNITGNGNLIINSSNGDGLTATNLTLTSGHVEIYASQRPLVNALIKGGEVIAFGNSATNDILKESSQKSFQINFLEPIKENEIINLVDANNNGIINQELKGEYKSFIYSSAYLSEGDYAFFKNDQKISFNGSDIFTLKDNVNYL